MKTKSKSKRVIIVKEVSKIIKPETFNFWFIGQPHFTNYFTVKYVYLNFPNTKSICPPSKKKSEKVYGQEKISKLVKDIDYVFGRKEIITYNNKKYDLTNELDFETLHHNLEVECALNNI